MNGGIKRSLKKLIFVCISILFMTVSAKATLVDSNSSIVVDNIEYYMQTNKSFYELGENVEMLYRVTNLGDEDVTIHFVDQVQYYFTVRHDDNIIWYAPKLGQPAESELVITPSSYKEYDETWDMFDNLGVLITPGNYEITGSLHPILLSQVDKDKYVPVSLFIEIIPEPATILLFGLGVLLVKARRFCPPTLSCRRWKSDVKMS